MPATRKRTSPPSGICAASTEPGPQAERVRHPEADLDLVRPADPPPLGQRRVLELRVVAGVGDEPHGSPSRNESAASTL